MTKCSERKPLVNAKVCPLILLELNELNFEWIVDYANRGKLPEFRRLLDNYGFAETTSEVDCENCEPWIQWVSAHSGKTFTEHGIFRLGDAVGSGIEQIWKTLEKQGISVGAISPMNAENDLDDAAYFIPDPWTDTTVTGGRAAQALTDAVKQLVNSNAGGRIGISCYPKLLLGAIRYASARNLSSYLTYSIGSKGKPWRRAMFLDRLLADVYLTEQKKHKPKFSTLFLNAGAHIQHHYLFNSSVYDGERKNPAWYVRDGDDPVLEAYECYDQVLEDIRSSLPNSRLMILTGLHQDPYPEITFYWRLRDHVKFLTEAGVPFVSIEPRMSRDFLVQVSSISEALLMEQILTEARFEHSDEPVFTVDNRGDSLFVTLVWPNDVSKSASLRINDKTFDGFRESLAFVAIKNGHHNPAGYFLDTDAEARSRRFPLTEVYTRILDHFSE